jgi:hypothetical protein
MSIVNTTSGWTREYEAVPVLRKLKGISHIQEFEKVQFIIFYGSAACGEVNPDSDLDIYIYFEGTKDEASRFRFEILSQIGDDWFEVQIFRQLPLYVRVQVLKGVVLFYRDLPFVYETAVLTIKEFESFKHRLYDYTGQALIS